MSQDKEQGQTGSFRAANASGAPTVPVSIFNANTLPINVMVNNGQSFQIAGVTAPTYAPQLPQSGGPSFSFGAPAQNTFGVGTNQVQITPQNSIVSNSFTMTLPASINYQSLQLYVFFANVNNVSWVLLQNGAILLQNTSING